MKGLFIPVIVLIVLCSIFVAYLIYSAPLMPEKVATHFGAGGQPNGWMSRSGHLLVMGALGLGMPLISVVIALLSRYIPPGLVNVPNRQYWFSPERREQTSHYITRQMLWMALLEVAFFTGIQYSIVEANRLTPAQLKMGTFWLLFVGFLVAVGIWSIFFILHFRKTEEQQRSVDKE
jgi:uncharacterized membrane protein